MKKFWKIVRNGSIISAIVTCFAGAILFFYSPTFEGPISFLPLFFLLFLPGFYFSIAYAVDKTKGEKNN